MVQQDFTYLTINHILHSQLDRLPLILYAKVCGAYSFIFAMPLGDPFTTEWKVG